MYELGILGGMGPASTAEFFRRLVDYTEAQCDQDHINTLIINNSSIPDRTDNITKGGISPVYYMNNCIKDLIKLNVENFVIPCNTAHYFTAELSIPNEIRFINMVKETMLYIEKYYPNHKVCILGTNGTVRGKVYEQINTINPIIYPTEAEQTFVMDVIRETKQNKMNVINAKLLNDLLTKIKDQINDVIFVLACTELSLYLSYISKEFLVVDSMDILAIRAIENCGYNVDESKLNYNYIKYQDQAQSPS